MSRHAHAVTRTPRVQTIADHRPAHPPAIPSRNSQNRRPSVTSIFVIIPQLRAAPVAPPLGCDPLGAFKAHHQKSPPPP